jgi:putative spermidine/putrescine transport system permease protein/spermidine/putrescine transport system permease protein
MSSKYYYLLLLPALALVTVVTIVPVASLLYISLTTDGSLTLEHYAYTLSSGSNRKIIYDTFLMSAIVTLCSAFFGYVVAYFVYRAPAALQALLFALILLPFWTSSLVRTYAWVVLLQRRGVVNQTLISIGLIDEPLHLVFNFTGAVIGMTYVTLPLFVLPLYGAMQAVDKNYLRAGRSLGATDHQVFWGIFFPLTAPAVVAGALMVFIYSLGFFATPQILGGGNVTIMAMKIQQSVTTYPDWETAASLGITLLVLTLLLLAVASQARRTNFFFRRFG